jgi:hypothetical protein
VIALRLAKDGFCGGDPEKILTMRADLVMAAYHLRVFDMEYERTYLDLNRNRE